MSLAPRNHRHYHALGRRRGFATGRSSSRGDGSHAQTRPRRSPTPPRTGGLHRLVSGPKLRPHQIRRQCAVELLDADRHLERIEGVLHDVVAVHLIASPHDRFRVRLLRAREQQEFDAGGRLEAGQVEVAGLEALDAGGRGPPVPGRRRQHGRCRVDRARDGVDAVEGAGEDEVVVAVELLQAGRERAVVDQPAGFVDDEEREDDPIFILTFFVSHVILRKESLARWYHTFLTIPRCHVKPERRQGGGDYGDILEILLPWCLTLPRSGINSRTILNQHLRTTIL